MRRRSCGFPERRGLGRESPLARRQYTLSSLGRVQNTIKCPLIPMMKSNHGSRCRSLFVFFKTWKPYELSEEPCSPGRDAGSPSRRAMKRLRAPNILVILGIFSALLKAGWHRSQYLGFCGCSGPTRHVFFVAEDAPRKDLLLGVELLIKPTPTFFKLLAHIYLPSRVSVWHTLDDFEAHNEAVP